MSIFSSKSVNNSIEIQSANPTRIAETELQHNQMSFPTITKANPTRITGNYLDQNDSRSEYNPTVSLSRPPLSYPLYSNIASILSIPYTDEGLTSEISVYQKFPLSTHPHNESARMTYFLSPNSFSLASQFWAYNRLKTSSIVYVPQSTNDNFSMTYNINKGVDLIGGYNASFAKYGYKSATYNLELKYVGLLGNRITGSMKLLTDFHKHTADCNLSYAITQYLSIGAQLQGSIIASVAGKDGINSQSNENTEIRIRQRRGSLIEEVEQLMQPQSYGITNSNIGLIYQEPSYSASIVTANNHSKLIGSYAQKLNKEHTVAMQAETNLRNEKENKLTIGTVRRIQQGRTLHCKLSLPDTELGIRVDQKINENLTIAGIAATTLTNPYKLNKWGIHFDYNV